MSFVENKTIKEIGLEHETNQKRLDSWKEVALHLGRDVRTVQRWEKHEGLPIHRHFHNKAGSIYAYKHEVDDWKASRSQSSCLSEGIVYLAPAFLDDNQRLFLCMFLKSILIQLASPSRSDNNELRTNFVRSTRK
jgi:hypothetical protein